MYMYNALFDFNNNSGLFSPTDDPNPGSPAIPFELRTSKNWLEFVSKPPGPFDPETAKWKNLGEASTLHLTKAKAGDILIRVAPDRRGDTFPSDDATLQLVLAFGRPVRFKQPQASPFTHNGSDTGNVLTTFILFPDGPKKRNTSRAWVINLGSIARGSGSEVLVHRYDFAMGAIVTEPATTTAAEVVRHYGEDPEMDIGD